MTKQQLAKGYKDQAYELATLIGKFEEISLRLKHLDEEEAGNFFPSMAAEEAFKPLACTLANTVVYWQEYEKGAEDNAGVDDDLSLKP